MVGKRGLILLLAGLLGLLLVGCGGESLPYAMADESQLPSFLDGADVHTREAYRFAIANQHELEKYPCYCGCRALNHADNAACYIRLTLPTGGITFDQHAVGCGVCVDITQDVMRMLREGRSSLDIRKYIDATYSQYGPPTDTEMPSA